MESKSSVNSKIVLIRIHILFRWFISVSLRNTFYSEKMMTFQIACVIIKAELERS